MTSSFMHLISLSTQSSAPRSRSQLSTATYGEPCSANSHIASSTLCPTEKSWFWPAFTVIAIPQFGKVGETHNHPLHLPAGVRLGEAYGLPLARRR